MSFHIINAPEFDIDFSVEYDLTYSADVIEVRNPTVGLCLGPCGVPMRLKYEPASEPLHIDE